MKRIQLLVLVLAAIVFLPSSSFAQSKVPGYMGKRFQIGYKYHFMPGYGKSPRKNADFTTSSDGTFKINTFHEGFMEYVVGRKTSLVASVRFSKAQFDPTGVNFTGSFDGVANEYGQLSYFGGGLGIRFYKKHLAPLSSYFGFNLGFLSMATDKYSFVSEYDGRRVYSATTGSSPYLGFEIGANKILYDHLVLSFNFEGSFVLAFFYNALINEAAGSFDVSDRDNNEQSIRTEAYWRVQQQQFINFSIGIGFLP